MTSLTVFFVLLFTLYCCLHQVTCSKHQQYVQTAKEQRNNQRQQHWNQKHHQQHSNYKQQIQKQRQGSYRYSQHYQKQPVYHYRKPVHHYRKPVYHHKGKRYHYKKKPTYIKWPRIPGHCERSPWAVDGMNPVMEEAAKGNAVLLYMLKVNDGYSDKQLIKMNAMGQHYRYAGKNVTMMVLSHRSRKLPAWYETRFPFIKFYQEPGSKNIYKLLRARYGANIIYDQCGRQQYLFNSPYSWLGYMFTSLAIDNVRHFHTAPNFCGVCKAPPKSTVTPPATNNPGTSRITTKPTETAFDGH